MIKEITYKGYSAIPMDYSCPDGDLALSLGAVCEKGALRAIPPPVAELTLDENDVVRYIHEVSGNRKHYIITTPENNGEYTNITYYSTATESYSQILNTPSEIFQIASLGNTLVILTSSGIEYVLWKNSAYHCLGSSIPEIAISFGLQGEVKTRDIAIVNFDSLEISNEDDQKELTEIVLASINKFIAEESIDKGKFLYPFLIRYAYRLFDGTLTKHSAPVLMVASSDIAPQIFAKENHGVYTDCSIVGVLHSIDYAVLNSSSELQSFCNNWGDIVKSIDIFISRPIYTYDQNGLCKKFELAVENDSFCICKHTNQHSYFNNPRYYQKKSYRELLYKTTRQSTTEYRLALPERSEDDIKAEIKNCAQFYLLEKINLDMLSTNRTIIDVKKGYLENIALQEVMTDDYDSHDTLLPQCAFQYNGRLNITNLRKQLFCGFSPMASFIHTDGFINSSDEALQAESVRVFVYMRQGGKEIVVSGDSGNIVVAGNQHILFFYYPNINAYRAIVRIGEMNTILELEQHNFLNGAFYFNGWSQKPSAYGNAPTVSSNETRTIDIDSKVYTSSVGNPYLYPLLGINTIGSGKVIGLSCAAKALSEGQFGQFPLYAFTTEGVWALSVSETGTYSTKQPITRDVCINTDSITQIDNSVLFATHRGIMQLSGSNSTCISEALNNDAEYPITSMPKVETLRAIFNEKALNLQLLQIESLSIVPFVDYLTRCSMLYDYVHQRIIVFNPQREYAYVYSLLYKEWGMMTSHIVSKVPSYPDAYAIERNEDNSRLLNFSRYGAASCPILLITRPISLDYPNIHKSIDTIIQRGVFVSNRIAQVLYASNDLINWQVVWSSRDKYLRGLKGTPYKAYRIAIVGTLDIDDSISGCSIQFINRLTNQPR